LGRAYVTGNEPVTVRLQFDPLARGKVVLVREGSGAIVDPPTGILHVGPTGECVVTVRLVENLAHGHISFYCEGLTTTLPLSRASLASVTAKETAGAAQ
jgi:hypothetical protein